MNESDFRFQDQRVAMLRQLEILQGNFRLFMRRALDLTYGGEEDRRLAAGNAFDTMKEIKRLRGG